MIARLLQAPIRWYQRTVSPMFPRRCKYEPTCSQYALTSLAEHGAIKGTILLTWRLLRCNPWSKGGVDWVPPKGSWPSRPLGYTELMAHRAKDDVDTSSDHRGHCDDHSTSGDTARPTRLDN